MKIWEKNTGAFLFKWASLAFEVSSLGALSQGVPISHSACHFGALCSCVLVETDTSTICSLFFFYFLTICLLKKKIHVHAAYLTTEQKVILIITFQAIFPDSYTENFPIPNFH